MSFRDDNLNRRRHELAATIARQRGELANAYRELAKPIQYAETGLRGFNFLRQNPWVVSVVPAAFTITSSLVGILRGKPAPKLSRASRLAADEEEAARLTRKAPKSLAGHVATWGGRGWKLFRLYRKVRKFL
jgi:YqjK-like protein